MTMKKQELKALEQIKKIVASLGEDSYIGTAFEGCFEIAEANITNDWACSMQQRVELLEREIYSLNERNLNLAAAKDRLAANLAEQKEIADRATSALKRLQEENDFLCSEAGALEEKIIELKETIKEKDDIILQLKAKLYDLMVG